MNIALAAEYCRVIRVKRIGLFYRVCNDSSVTVLKGGNISLFPLHFSRICRNQTSIYPLLIIDFKNASGADLLAASS